MVKLPIGILATAIAMITYKIRVMYIITLLSMLAVVVLPFNLLRTQLLIKLENRFEYLMPSNYITINIQNITYSYLIICDRK